ncbi:helix-hairpin-helix domain-containing protein [Bifidobacterium sp. 82T25]|nr:helix-hairpin-helix domain-containing protein [Bifidobacterium miconisargentati]
MIGVRPSDAAGETSRRKRDKPRLVFTVNQALVVILLLIAALGVSLTMLVQQSMNLTALSGGGTALTSDNDDGEAAAPSSDRQGKTQGDTSDNENDGGDDVANGVSAHPNDSELAESEQNADAATTPEPDDGRIDLNTATSEQLQTINGIGPVTAERIIEHRKVIGRFVSVDQLLDVKGIGSKTLEKIRDQVKVG